MRSLLLLLIFSTNTQAFQLKQGAKQSTEGEREVEALVTRLAGLPFEMEADALLMLIGAGKLPAADIAPTLERLFINSARSTFSSPLIAMYPQFDTSSGNIESAKATASRALGLDQLSIQTRVIAKQREIDPNRAMHMLDQIRPPQTPRSCSDSLMPSVDRYYQSLLKLYQIQAASKNRKVREHADQWLRSHLSLEQESQIAPIARLILKLGNEQELFEFSLARYSRDLGNLSPAFLPYFASLETVTGDLIALAKRSSEIGQSSAGLWQSFAAYNRKALTGVRCTTMPADVLARRLQQVQAKLKTIELPSEAREILDKLESLQPDRLDTSKPELQSFDSDAGSKNLMQQYAELRVGPIESRKRFVGKRRPDGLPSFLPLEERKTAEWDEKAALYLRRIETLVRESQDDSLASFLKVSEVYSSLIQILPVANNTFAGAVSSYLSYLSASPVLKEYPLVWLVEVKLFLRRGTLDEYEAGQVKVREAIRRQGSDALNALLEVDRFNPMQSNSNMSTLYVHVP
jgi:hypothetical protein